MFHSVFILLYFLTQMMHTAHKVNDFKCDIQYMHLKVELVMLESLPGTA